MAEYPGKRICQVVKLRPERVEEYKRVHQSVPEPVMANIRKYHIEDYSIHYAPNLNLLIATFKYLGDDLEADSAKMRQDPDNQKWWALTDGMQETFIEGSEGSVDEAGWWLPLEEVFRLDK